MKGGHALPKIYEYFKVEGRKECNNIVYCVHVCVPVYMCVCLCLLYDAVSNSNYRTANSRMIDELSWPN
jgi:hypothetical protein